MRKFLSLFLAFCLLLSTVGLSAEEAIYLEPLVDEAIKNNPEILAAAKRYEAAKARIPQAKSLEDPVLGLGFQYTPGSPFQLSKTPPIERMLSISEAFPFFGKLSLKGKIALVESQMFAAEYKNKQLEVVNSVKNAYYGLFLNYKEIELSRNILRLLEDIAKTAESKYIVGDAAQEDVFKIHIEIAGLSNKILNLKEELTAKKTRLNTLLNRDAEGLIGIPQLKEDVSFQQDISRLYRLTLENQPELLIFSYAIEKNKHAKDLAKRSFFPDFMAQVAMRGITSGNIGPWDLMMAFTVPLWFWTKQRYQVKEAVAGLEEAKAAYQAMKNKALQETKDLAARIEITKNKIRLNKTNLIPLLEASIESSLAGLRSGKGDFMMLLDSERMLVEAKMDYYRALVEYNTSLADLERAVGMELKNASNTLSISDAKHLERAKQAKE